MKIDKSANNQDIYLINGNKNVIKVEDIIANRTSEIVFIIP